jgi:hypothetical protein
MTNFPIQIDATQLVYQHFSIHTELTIDYIDTGSKDSRMVQTLSLHPGAYKFQVGAGSADIADFTFSVTAQGTVDYDASFDAFLTGRGSSRLTIVGFQVTLDARYLSGSGVELVVFDPVIITYKTCRMVPTQFYTVKQGTVVASLKFTLGLDGKFSYESQFSGFLAGHGTSTLEFLGYPILVDARAAKGAGLSITGGPEMPFTLTAVQFAVLLPSPTNFALQVNSGPATRGVFSLDPGGIFSFDNSLDPYLEFQTFNGLTLLKVKGPLPV